MIAESDIAAERPRLVSVAYRMLGSAAEADDAVQDALLRAVRDPSPEPIRSAQAYLTTVVTRVCLDRLKSAKTRRETYTGPWLPEPVRTDVPNSFGARPDARDAGALSIAFLVLLETLSPLERAAFLLHEVFDYSHAEVGEMLERDVAAIRQLVHRARTHVEDGRPRFAPNRDAHQHVLTMFLGAISSGDVAALAQLLADDVVARGDGGGKALAALKPLRGPDRVARFFLGTFRKFGPGGVPSIVEINGWPALVVRDEGRVVSVTSIETDGERVVSIASSLNPDKLRYVGD